MNVVILAPIIAPLMVKISRNMATLILVILSLTYDEAEPLEVAIMLTMEEAIATFTGTPNKTRTGIKTLAPPNPVSDPRKPTATARKLRVMMFKSSFSCPADFSSFNSLV